MVARCSSELSCAKSELATLAKLLISPVFTFAANSPQCDKLSSRLLERWLSDPIAGQLSVTRAPFAKHSSNCS